MKQIGSVPRPCPSDDIVGRSGLGHRGTQAAGGNGRRTCASPMPGRNAKLATTSASDKKTPELQKAVKFRIISLPPVPRFPRLSLPECYLKVKNPWLGYICHRTYTARPCISLSRWD